jgi:ubiquinone/menaquinone biosynthesis C-methylase UbiE
VSVDRRAEKTNLKSDSTDQIVVGQALHWFDLEKTRIEFARILREHGYISIIYNHRNEQGEVETAYAELVARYAKNRAPVPDIDDSYVKKFLRKDRFRKFSMPNSYLTGVDIRNSE